MSAEHNRVIRFRVWGWPSSIVIPEQVMAAPGTTSEHAVALAIVQANGGPEMLRIEGMNQTTDGKKTFRISLGTHMGDVPTRTYEGYIAID